VERIDSLVSVWAGSLGYVLVKGTLGNNEGYSLIYSATRSRTDYRTLDSVLGYLAARENQIQEKKN